MPTVLIEAGFRFHFFSADGHEPPHVHVDKDGREAKVWLAEVRFAKRGGFNEADMRRIISLVNENKQMLMEAWNGYFHR